MTDLPDNRELRASDRDRDRVAEQLRDAAGEGRLTLGELEERLDLTFRARTYGDLVPITSDLPIPTRGESVGPPADVSRAPREIRTILGSQHLNGRFVVPSTMHARAVLGEVKIDLTEAIVPRGEVVIEADAFLGEVTLTVPEGVDLRLETGTNVLGERKSKLPAPSSPDAPVIRVRGSVVLGSVKVEPRRWNRLRKMVEGA
ncbi:MAG: DUF1707 and DUF2154 domain-containing protein [Streptosporangiales bacterium]|nr:DUF1707 and DUF2154 domain-containing protein [Streptosporangiales bacterium]MBO0891821.1 DUF1707 and DUF2154 domain-containing protein [Acidothermales bacterium]